MIKRDTIRIPHPEDCSLSYDELMTLVLECRQLLKRDCEEDRCPASQEYHQAVEKLWRSLGYQEDPRRIHGSYLSSDHQRLLTLAGIGTSYDEFAQDKIKNPWTGAMYFLAKGTE